MVEKGSVGCAALVLGCAGGNQGDVTQELELVLNANELKTLLNAALDTLTISSDVAEERSELAGLEDKLGERLMAKLTLSLTESALQIGIEADERQVIDSGCGIGSAEVACVEASHAAECDLRLLASCIAEQIITAADIAHSKQAVVIKSDSEVNRRHVVVRVQVGNSFLKQASQDLHEEESGRGVRQVTVGAKVALANVFDRCSELVETVRLMGILINAAVLACEGELQPKPVHHIAVDVVEVTPVQVAAADQLVDHHTVRVEAVFRGVAHLLGIVIVDLSLQLRR